MPNLIFVSIAALALVAAAYGRLVYKDMAAQREDDELHFDPWED